MADFNNLAKDMERLEASLGASASNAAQSVAIAVLNDLVQATPADTGTAISNWQVTLDAPAEGILPAHVPSPKGRVKKGIWQHAVDPLITAEANAPATVEAGYIALQKKTPGQDIFITNNLEYIQELNSGSSDQAPAGFVERAELIAEQVVGRTQI